MPEFKKLTEEFVNIVKSAGAFIRSEAASFDRKKTEYKGFNDLVSYVDREAESRLVEQLSALLPEAGFITEESDHALKDHAAPVWIVDPLDGTTNFIHGLPVYAVSVALFVEQEPVCGAVYEINKDECFYAYKNGGAFCNGTAVYVSKAGTLQESLIATGFPYYNFEKMPLYLEILNDLMRTTHGLRRMGSAAVDLAYTACGRFEGFFEYNLNAWDVAAGALLVQEAGGTVTDFSGRSNFLFGREITAATVPVHKELLRTIQERWTNHEVNK